MSSIPESFCMAVPVLPNIYTWGLRFPWLRSDIFYGMIELWRINKEGGMATIEERLTLIEHEHAKLKSEHVELKSDNAELKKTIELQTIAIGALVNKATLERLNEKYDKIFDSLIAHDRFTNEQLTELRGQQTELDGKIVGLQMEMRQRFEQHDQRFDSVEQRLDRMEATQTQHTALLTQILARLPEKP